MAYRFGGKQKELAFGVYPPATLADARTKRDAAKGQHAKGIDPAVAKQEAKREQAATGVHSTGAQICIYADVHSDYNPFRKFADGGVPRRTGHGGAVRV
jgi:hypothetical protein